ncbi:hypothetical protein J32TS6_40970 [Virgibacillus pantothenticus]|uniref:Uncharacterized protein n=1 Tax=Virgibacillus pantothenticus TaxID=1473 RepID=A0A0L0QSH3_VIRPA|nr:hypothetical protein AFK71_08450 [Virgibacillus pantothenticus]GIP65542.1 hypothetical protein J32TS6_40970 [Virgibacillus pantothenticus]
MYGIKKKNSNTHSLTSIQTRDEYSECVNENFIIFKPVKKADVYMKKSAFLSMNRLQEMCNYSRMNIFP